jgi:GNAT superfamily N-acetyltransferase
LTATIEYLIDHPEHISRLARWHYHQWSYLFPGDSLKEWEARVRAHLGRNEIPTTFVAVTDQEAIGSASLIDHDMDTRIHLSPWLAAVYVAPDHRRQGVGTALVRRVMREARTLDIPRLYLYTPDKESFYARRGWTVLERIQYRGYAQVVMALDVSARGQLDPPRHTIG